MHGETAPASTKQGDAVAFDRVESHTMTSQRSTSSAPASLSRRRRIVIWTLVVLATVIALVGTLTLWVKRQMLDNNSWRSASESVITDPEIKNSLSIYLVNQLYDNVDVAGAIAARLPENAKSAASTIAGALRQPATNAVNQLLARPRVEQLFINASTTAHEKLVNVLEDKTGFGISTGSGNVTIDLTELVRELGQELGLSDEALAKLPADAGMVTLLKSDQLGSVQKGVKAIHVLSAWLLVAVLVLYALAIYLARGQRRETLRNVGWSFALVGLVALLVRRVVGNYAVDTLASPGYRGTVRDLWLIGSSILHAIGIATVAYGLITVAGAVLAGPTKWATSVRRWIAPTLNEHQAVAWGALAGVVLLLATWGPTHALRTWWGVLLFAALLAVGLVALRRQTLVEFPPESHEAEAPAAASPGGDAPTAPVAPAD
jgi:hypothetical protein